MQPQCRLGDSSFVPLDVHGHNCCPHACIGPAIAGSPDVFVNGRPALRVSDNGIHAACCGPNTWVAQEGSPTVLINNLQAHRLFDVDMHCGGPGYMVEASEDVFVGDLGSGGGGSGSGGSPSGASSSGDSSGGSPSDSSGGDDSSSDDVSSEAPPSDSPDPSPSPYAGTPQDTQPFVAPWKNAMFLSGGDSFAGAVNDTTTSPDPESSTIENDTSPEE